MNSKQLTVLSIIVLMLTYQLSMAQWQGDTYESAKSKKTANWIIPFNNTPGITTKSSSGEIRGVAVDMMNDFKEFVEKKKGITISISYQSKYAQNYASFLASVRTSSGGVFGVGNTSELPAGKRVFHYSPAYLGNVSIMLTQLSVATLTDITEIKTQFKNMTAVTVKNSLSELRLLQIKKEYYPNLNITYVKSFDAALEAVMLDSKKFTSIDFVQYYNAVKTRKPLKRHPKADQKMIGIAVIMPKSNDWYPLLAEFLSSGYLDSVEYKKAVANNLGQTALKFFGAIDGAK